MTVPNGDTMVVYRDMVTIVPDECKTIEGRMGLLVS